MIDAVGLERLLRPKSVAIVGLSADPQKHGARVLANLRAFGFDGEVWGVHPRGEDLYGVSTYSSLREVPGSPDVVVLAIPAPRILEAIEDAGAVGAGGAILFSGGFAESGGDGRALQDAVTQAAREGGVRLLGPNSAGIINAADSVVLSFLTCLERPADQLRPGPVALISQSGGTASYIQNLAAERGRGTAITVSTGNEADLDVGELLAQVIERPDVAAVALVLETIRNGPSFIAAAQRALELGKPLVACRLGTSEVGKRVMASHTGALAGEMRRFEAVFDAFGITVTETPEELFDVADLLARVPAVDRGTVGVVTHSGGTAVLLGDQLAQGEVSLPEPSARLRERLGPHLQLGASGNPTDLGGIITAPERFGDVVTLFLEDPAYAMVVATSTPHPPAHSMGRAERLCELAAAHETPLLNLWLAGDLGSEALARLRSEGVPVTTSVAALTRAIHGAVRFGQARRRPQRRSVEPLPTIIRDLSAFGTRAPTEFESKQLLAQLGLPVTNHAFAVSPDEAAEAATRIGFPVVAKLSSSDLSHKSDVGGVTLDLPNPAAVRAACSRMLDAVRETSPEVSVDGFLIEEFASGVEMILGITRDPTFGPLVLVGLGGTLAEVLDDVRIGVPPFDEAEAMRLVRSLDGSAVLRGFRGVPAVDQTALAEMLVRLSDVALAYADQIEELDLNPVTFSGGRWRAADALLRLRPPDRGDELLGPTSP